VALALQPRYPVKHPRLALIAVASLATACSVVTVPAETPTAQGRRLFTEHGCYGCHTLLGTGTPIAPDLSHAGSRYSEAQRAQRLRDPAVHRPGAHMPKLALTDADIRALAAYLATLR
jgi:cytochrome c553